MRTPFDLNAPLVVVRGYITGTVRTVRARLVIDTAATGTQIATRILTDAGVDLSRPARQRRMWSATGGAMIPVVSVRHLLALGQARADFPVAAHDMPPAVTYDGLLGLDFFRGQVLTLDFARGRVTLHARRWWQFWR